MRPIVTKEYDHSWNLFDRHLYPGGSWRIHMLRKLVGDESFWAAINDYLTTHHKGLVETEDFKRALERHSGRNLAKFFDQVIIIFYLFIFFFVEFFFCLFFLFFFFFLISVDPWQRIPEGEDHLQHQRGGEGAGVEFGTDSKG